MSFSFEGKSVFLLLSPWANINPVIPPIVPLPFSNKEATHRITRCEPYIPPIVPLPFPNEKATNRMQALQIALLLLTPTYGLFITISQKIWVFLVQVPVKQQVLVNYIAYLFSRDYVATTVIACFSVVSYIHKLYNLKDHVHLFWYKNCCAQPVSIFCTTQSLYIISYSF